MVKCANCPNLCLTRDKDMDDEYWYCTWLESILDDDILNIDEDCDGYGEQNQVRNS